MRQKSDCTLRRLLTEVLDQEATGSKGAVHTCNCTYARPDPFVRLQKNANQKARTGRSVSPSLRVIFNCRWTELDPQSPIWQRLGMGITASSFKLRANAPEGAKAIFYQKYMARGVIVEDKAGHDSNIVKATFAG